jgi:hypothetical protein
VKTHRRTALFIGVVAESTLALPLTNCAGDFCGLPGPRADFERGSSTAAEMAH